MAISRKEIGTRLRDLREAIGFTQAYVASKLVMHRPTITEIEAGRRAVTSEELARFAALYATPIGRLLADASPTADDAIAVLCRRTGKEKPETRRAIRQFVERCREERELEQLLDLASARAPRPDYGALPPRTKGEAIQFGELFAAKERERLGLGTEPVRSVLSLLQRQGVAIGPLPDGGLHDDLDGFFLDTDELGPCVAVNEKDYDIYGYRAAFTGAHEYAHWILRDRTVELLPSGAPTDNDPIEVRANTFAAAFLMPRDGLRKYLVEQGAIKTGSDQVARLTPGDVVRAMNHFGVSRTALLFRLLNLRFIQEAQHHELLEFIVSSVANQLKIILAPSEAAPNRRGTLARLAWRSGLISASRAADLSDLDIGEFKRRAFATGEVPDVPSDMALLGAAAE